MIEAIKFFEPIQVGPSSTVVTYLTNDLKDLNNNIIDGFRLAISLDDDTRFVLIAGQHIEKVERKFYQRVPLTAVASLLYKDHPNGQPVSKQPATTKK